MAILGLVYTIQAEHSGFSRPLHRHEFRIEVTFKGKLIDGAVAGLDFSDIKIEVKEIVEELNHKNLNKIMNLPTVENIAIFLIKKLGKFPVYSVKVWEESDRYAKVFAAEV